MNAHSASELSEFHNFIGMKLHNGGSQPSPEEVLDEWRTLHPEPISDDDLVAIQEAITDVESGDRGIPFEEFKRQFRIRHDIDPSL